jgi:stage III sporulation protein E
MLKKGTQQSGGVSDEVRHNAAILQDTLRSFNIDAKMLNASQGPAVTRFELEPAAGVKVSKIVHLADDIALKLAATDIRIEAPIPGKAAVGIEVPNTCVAPVTLRDVLESDSFRLAKGGVPVGLGKDIAGNPIVADLTKMPHLLVAGSTGSGKSVCINTFIASILFKQRPEDVKLILVDPKVVELSNYNGIPHLMTPVVTDPKKAASVLRWAVREMDDRYKRFAVTRTRDISRFNELHPEEAMPFVVIIIDELADLMMAASGDVEESICRLAQKARACGMHLVLATQRPSVDVLTGLIKANIPSRIAFAVSSQIDSRTILDMAGAEKLIGKGDMLFYPMGASKPLRVQGAFIGDGEIDALTEWIKEQGKPQYDQAVQQAQEEDSSEEGAFFEDELMGQAVDMVLETGQASASMLQRRFRIGYTRAARLIDTMEAMKIVGPNHGSKPREILMTAEEVQKKIFSAPV